MVTLGLEERPAARAGWFVEAGVGGGARLALGYRWRRMPRAGGQAPEENKRPGATVVRRGGVMI